MYILILLSIVLKHSQSAKAAVFSAATPCNDADGDQRFEGDNVSIFRLYNLYLKHVQNKRLYYS
jgi:hypothetical protein